MDSAILAIRYAQLTLFGLIFVLASFYSITTLVVLRLYHRNQILTVNLCVAAIGCSAYWFYFYTALTFFPQYFLNPDRCPANSYFEMMCTLQVPLAMITVSVHRCCSILYHTKAFFKTKRWVILCIASQWTVGFLVALPRTRFNPLVRSHSGVYASEE